MGSRGRLNRIRVPGPFGGIHVFISKIGEPAPEPDICTDIIETARRASPPPVQPEARHVFVGVVHGSGHEDGPVSDGETVVCSDDESSGETESLNQLQDGQIDGGSEGNSIPDSPDLPNRVAIFMAGHNQRLIHLPPQQCSPVQQRPHQQGQEARRHLRPKSCLICSTLRQH